MPYTIEIIGIENSQKILKNILYGFNVYQIRKIDNGYRILQCSETKLNDIIKYLIECNIHEVKKGCCALYQHRQKHVEAVFISDIINLIINHEYDKKYLIGNYSFKVVNNQLVEYSLIKFNNLELMYKATEIGLYKKDNHYELLGNLEYTIENISDYIDYTNPREDSSYEVNGKKIILRKKNVKRIKTVQTTWNK